LREGEALSLLEAGSEGLEAVCAVGLGCHFKFEV
jgi:hypothetical protein